MRSKSDLRSAQQRTITRLYADEALAYDAETGALTWRERPLHHFKSAHAKNGWNAKNAGHPVGAVHITGYVCTTLERQPFKVHRLIWLLVHGYLPAFVDHINGDRADNRLANLREATKQDNGRNQRRPKTNTSGCLGVSLDRRGGKWRAYIRDGERNVSLGYYPDKDAAIAARKVAEARLGYHPNHGRD